MKRQRFAPHGTLAVAPGAFGLLFDLPESREPQAAPSPVAVVEIVGPLMHHEEWLFDSYDGIKSRVERVLAASETKCCLLSIDSPGGLVAGCFDTVTELRMLSEKYGKPLFAYVDAQTESAAYALACAAERIYVPVSGRVGSIGCVEMMVDVTEADRQWGLKFFPITSGARKADGNPHVAVTKDALAAAQQNVDSLAAIFFELVAERRGISIETVRGFEARSFIGQEAIDAGLADEMATLDQVVAKLTAEFEGEQGSTAAAQTGASTSAKTPLAGMVSAGKPTAGAKPVGAIAMKLSEAKAGLKALAEDENAPEKDRENARKALAAMGDEEENKDGDGDEDKAEAKSEGDADDEKEGDDKAECKPDDKAAATGGPVAAARAAITAGPSVPQPPAPAAQSTVPDGSSMALAARVQVLEAREQDRADVSERRELLARRPDFSREVEAFVRGLPIQQMRDACRPPAKAGQEYDPQKHGLPLGPGKGGQVGAARAAIGAKPTVPQGASYFGPPPVAGEAEANHPLLSASALDEAMGLRVTRPLYTEQNGRFQVRTMSQQEARSVLQDLQKGAF